MKKKSLLKRTFMSGAAIIAAIAGLGPAPATASPVPAPQAQAAPTVNKQNHQVSIPQVHREIPRSVTSGKILMHKKTPAKNQRQYRKKWRQNPNAKKGRGMR